VRLRRAQAVTQDRLGEDYVGIIVGSDRAGVYNILPLGQRQICWAHLKREFTAIAERSAVSAEIGQTLRDIPHDIFTLWYDFRAGTIGRAGLRKQLWPLRQALNQVLREAVSFGTQGKTPLAKLPALVPKFSQSTARAGRLPNIQGWSNNTTDRQWPA
jgi:hypothetical protein